MNVCWKNWASLNPGQHQSQPQDRLGLRQALCLRGTSYLGLLYQRSEHTSEEALCGCWKNGSLASVDGLTCPQAHTCCQGTCRLCVCVDSDERKWCTQDCMCGFGAWHSAALNPNFSCTTWSHSPNRLLDSVPDEQSDLCCPWKSWCCVMYSAVDSFFRRMNFNVFFPLLPSTFPLQTHRFFRSISLHCWILFFLLPLRTPITTCPVEKQSCETQSEMETAKRMSISSNRLRGQFFSCGGRLGWCQTWGPMSLNVLKPAWVNLKMHWIPYKEALKYQCQPISVHLQSRVIGIFGVCSC